MKFEKFDQKMRFFEEALDQSLPPGIWPVIRLDGRCFTRLSQKLNFQRPFDETFRNAMVTTMRYLMNCGFQSIYAYTESDEISLLFFKNDETFRRKIRKWISVLAGEASSILTHSLKHPVAFDARICPLSDVETVIDYFCWRRGDAERNSLNSYCYWQLRNTGTDQYKANKILLGTSMEEKINLLRHHKINHKEIPKWQRYGIGVYWEMLEKQGFNPVLQQNTTTLRRSLTTQMELPSQKQYSDFLKQVIDGYFAQLQKKDKR